MNKLQFIVHKIKRETEDTITVFLFPENKKFDFEAGQYMSVYLDKDKNGQAKFYTISSAPSEKFIALSVKKMGNFSTALHNLKVGDSVYLSGPYGWFFPKPEMDELVFLASGIGITPFFSTIKDYQYKNIEKQIDIFYTNKTKKDIAFYNDLNKIVQKNDKIRVHYYLTENEKRMDVMYIKEKIGNFKNKNFYICGSIGFVSDFRKQLLGHKVQEENIFTESFF